MADNGTEGDPPGLDSEDAATGVVPNEPKSSKGWLKLIADAEKALDTYQKKSDNIDKQYANLERLANTTRDREIQLFWANISVMAPSTYSRPPVPVVTPRFKDDAELKRTASELLERACVVAFEKEDVDSVMRLIRDDLVILARGVPWLRLEGTERVAIEHADRKDWLCEAARKWKDVDWVAKRSWLTKPEARKRFKATSGAAYKDLQYSVRKDAEADADDGASKAGIWELWCKSRNVVVWVAEGSDVCLDSSAPHLKLEGFFPCPRPAYGTVERRSLVPVPDMLFYKDQLEEINDITDRIAALTDAVKVRGFYASGAGDVSDAVEAAFKNTSNNTVLVPIANLQGLSGVALKDAIAWLPIEVITATITALIAVRKELINDVYEVTGLSDIMRGQTEASETLGAQQLKSQYGSVRIKDRQDELTRVARDITRITAEIMAENFDGKTLMEMAQMPLPSDQDIEAKAAPLKQQLQKAGQELPQLQAHLQHLQGEIAQAAQDPEVHQMAAQNPDKAKEVMQQVQQQMQQGQQKVQQMQAAGQQAQQQLQALAATVTIDAVLKLLRAQKLRPFILDIETDSTITPDENAAKQQANELVTAVGGYLQKALPLVQENPQAAPMVAETLKFVVKPFRAGRELQGVIDKFADDMKAKAQQPPPPNPEAIKAQQEAAAAQAKQQQDAAAQQHQQQIEAQKAAADAQAKGAQAQKDQADAEAQSADTQRMALEADTAAKDADLARRIKEQQEKDASDARRQEMQQKADMGALALAAAREKHAQDMEKGQQDLAKGALDIELKQKQIAHSAVTTAGTIAKDDAAVAAHEAAAKKPEATK